MALDPWLYGVITVAAFMVVQIVFGVLARYRFRRQVRRLAEAAQEAARRAAEEERGRREAAAEPPPSYETHRDESAAAAVQPLPPPPPEAGAAFHMGGKVEVMVGEFDEEDEAEVSPPSYAWAVALEHGGESKNAGNFVV